jgi:DNA-directed RNA polymerase II subunit RPB3
VDEERVNLDGGLPNEDEPFNYDAVPNRFFFDVETVGGLDPDQIVQTGIQTLQQKLAGVIQELRGEDMDGADFGGVRSPQMNSGGYGQDYGNNSVWGNNAGPGGGTTPYGATPYGNSW